MQRVNALANQTGQGSGVPQNRRAVVVCGTRTPFVRAFSELVSMDNIALSCAAVKGLIERSKIDPNLIDHMVFGGVILQNGAPNIAREVVIDLKLPHKISGHTVTMACASGLQAVLNAAMLIESNNADVVIAGGADSTSCAEMPLARHVTQSLALYSYGKIGVGKLFSVAGLPCSWMPKKPEIAERSTGKTMGHHADLSAEFMKVTRKAQDELAMASHKNAADAAAKGLFNDEIVPVEVAQTALAPKAKVTKDTMVRSKQDPAKMATLKPVFRKDGTITAANASPLTDGAAAVLIMSAEKARALGYPADIAIRSHAASGINPNPNLLMAPAIAIPLALKRAGLTLDDISFFEIHEAFAGQVLATIEVLASDELSKKHLGQPALGRIPREKVNIYGGSVSIGHPFGATGARLTTNAARILRNNAGAKYVLVSICAAGGLGLVTIFEKI